MEHPPRKNCGTDKQIQRELIWQSTTCSRSSVGDLVITSDIPLAGEVIDKGGKALSPRGELHTTGRGTGDQRRRARSLVQRRQPGHYQKQ
jgi:uncharacterized protein YaiI (UPF0178 family)